MSTYLLPTDSEFVEQIARAIARNRLYIDASKAMTDMIGLPLDATPKLEESFDRIFENLWAGTAPNDEGQRTLYRGDAMAAIRAINLKLMTTPE